MKKLLKEFALEMLRDFLFASFAVGLFLVIALIYATMYMVIAKEWVWLTSF